MLLLLASLAVADPLPPPEDVASDADYRRILGLGVVAAGSADISGSPSAAVTGELWLFETVGFGVGAWFGPVVIYADISPLYTLIPVITWDFRVLSVHRRLAVDVVGRHPLDVGATGGIGGAIEYRVAGPHLARLAVLGQFDGSARAELAYTLRWER